MADIEENDQLIKDLNQDFDGMRIKKKKSILIAAIILILVLALIIIIIAVTVKGSNSDSDNKEEEGDSPSEIDTIPKEEMDKARKAFKQEKYIDNINSDYELDYNIFIPPNYSEYKKYPLIIFIEDASLVGNKGVKTPLDNTVGGPIWATDREQKKHECFVLVPQYKEKIIDDNNNTYFVSEYINVTVRLIQKITREYSINPDRIYSTGQSMGAMTTLYLLSNYPNLLAAGLIVDGQWRIDELSGLTNSTFTYFAAEGDEKAYKGQTEVKEFLDSLNITYGTLSDLNATDKVENLNKSAEAMYDLNYFYNFITYKKGTVLPPNSKSRGEHMASFKYGYRIDKVRDWLFEQNRIKCEKGYYNSEDGKCANTNYCNVTKKDSSCKECIEGYFLTEYQDACTKVKNCESGNKKNGECNYCIKDYYLDLQENVCKVNTIDEKYKFCKIVNNGLCIDCEIYYYLSGDNKCSITPNCSVSQNTLCTKCNDGYHLGKDNKCCSVEKCIYSNRGTCTECEDGYYFDVYSNICTEGKDNFVNCKANSYYSPDQCSICKNDYYLSTKDYLCYDNTAPGPFYKCEIGNILGDKCITCVDGYFIGQIDSNCSKIEGCLQSLDENTCIECDDYYCMDNKGNCSDNSYVINEDIKYYFRCKKLTEDGKKCDICEHDLNATTEGICYDDVNCEEFKDQKCIKCKKDNPWGYPGYCLNEEFGCVDSFLKHCIRCDDIMDMEKCTKCEEGYEIDELGYCVEIE